MNKEHLLILGGAALVGWFMVDSLSLVPGFKQVASQGNSLAALI